jgi:hypothetical protein
LGQVTATPGAIQTLEESGQTPEFFLERHQTGDWGHVCDADRQSNEEAIQLGGRILSAYRTLKGANLWVVTEADRTVTTILTPEEY